MVLLLAVACLSRCGSQDPGTDNVRRSPAAPVDLPRVRVLGTAQDGGLPHVGCDCARCSLARVDPASRRNVASLAILLPTPARAWLVDATPDLARQLDMITDARPRRGAGVDRKPLEGVFLTHAHLGHYTGLALFGFEAMHTRGLPVYCTPNLADFLRNNGPWDQLVDFGNIELEATAPGEPVELGQGVRVTPVAVPHRDEYADTVGYLIRGPTRSLLYVPDTDPWSHWMPSLPDRLAEWEVDVALLDATFFSGDELPGRDLASIGHPLVRDSLDLLEPLVRRGKIEVWFTHMNHSNAAVATGVERDEIEARGFGVASDGQEFPL